MNNIKITQPFTSQEFEQYYQLRWEILRKPWAQPPGSERDEFENEAFHWMAVDEAANVCGVCRLHFIDNTTGQIRFMAVKPNLKRQGIGLSLLSQAESYARKNEIYHLILQAREDVVGFYQRMGYHSIEKTFLLYDEIQHFLMEKELI